MDLDYGKLVSVGYKLFGPVISPALLSIVDETETFSTENVLFIGREGYFLKRLANEYRDIRYPASKKRYHYFNASRAFLFRLLLCDRNTISFTLRHHFKGSFLTLLTDRYCFSAQETSLVSKHLFDMDVALPRDRSVIEDLMWSIVAGNSIIHDAIKNERHLYVSYIEKLTSGENPVLVDIGFSGTIQKCVSMVTGKSSRGLYFCTTRAFSEKPEYCPPVTGSAYWVSDAKFGDLDPLVDWSMVIEALLTAPYGQLRGISPDPSGKVNFLYKPPGRTLKHFHILNTLIDGCSLHIRDLERSKILPSEWSLYFDSRKIYEAILKYDRSKEMNMIRDVFEIDDSVSGFERRNPFTFLEGLSG